ncbi:MAG: penicillin-binding protein 2 [Ignavibacteria bacterium]|nr:penicillin-binding protein 2 [Ignavibacteria bacterium]
MSVVDDMNTYGKRRVMYLVIVIVFLFFMGRLYQLQLIYQDEYGKKSEANSIRTIPTEPVRGYMYDRNGRLVVDNRPSFTVTVMPFEFNVQNINSLSSVLSLDPEIMHERLKKGAAYSRFAPVKIQRDINFETLSVLEEYREHLPGVDYHTESKRYYPTRARASHILGYTKEISESQLQTLGKGYTQGDVVGSAGLEQQYEAALRGQKGAEFRIVNARGQVMGPFNDGRNDIPPVEGKDLLLTLDFDLQALAESLMADKRGALVALDPRDGGILALVSKPDYDISLFSGVTPPEVWRTLNTDGSKPLFNRATLTRYPPGSAFKVILAIGALEKDIVKSTDRITCRGSFRVGNKVFKDLHVHGSTDLYEAIQRSCNVYFYQLMLRVGLDNWSHYGAAFGFGQATGIDIFEESSGLLPTTEWMNQRYGERGWTIGYLPNLAIGQGELGVTPIQMACYAMALANKGSYYEPHAVSAIVDKVNKVTEPVPHKMRQIDLLPTTWSVVREGMRRVVQEPGGTAGLARIKGIEAGGKTGTAQNPHGEDHAWFVGFAPFDNPSIAIAVMIENVGYGGSFAAPIAGLCMEQFVYGRLIRFDKKFVPVEPSVAKNAKQEAIPGLSLDQTNSAETTR